MRPNANHAHFIWALGLSWLWATSCADDATCDEGQKLENGLCKVMPDDAGTGGAGFEGAGGEAGGAGQESAGAAGACGVQFGDACQDDADCGCEAPVCATLPGNFLCTKTCDEDPDACPEGFVCEDLSRFGDFPATCFPAGALSF